MIIIILLVYFNIHLPFLKYYSFTSATFVCNHILTRRWNRILKILLRLYQYVTSASFAHFELLQWGKFLGFSFLQNDLYYNYRLKFLLLDQQKKKSLLFLLQVRLSVFLLLLCVCVCMYINIGNKRYSELSSVNVRSGLRTFQMSSCKNILSWHS